MTEILLKNFHLPQKFLFLSTLKNLFLCKKWFFDSSFEANADYLSEAGLASLCPAEPKEKPNNKTFSLCEKRFFDFLSGQQESLRPAEKSKNPLSKLRGFCCCPSRIRTYIVGTKNRSPAIRRSGILILVCKNTNFFIQSNIFSKKSF